MDEALFCRDNNHLARPLIEGRVVSIDGKHPETLRQAHGERRRMRQPLSLCHRSADLCRRLIGISETEKYNPQIPL